MFSKENRNIIEYEFDKYIYQTIWSDEHFSIEFVNIHRLTKEFASYNITGSINI